MDSPLAGVQVAPRSRAQVAEREQSTVGRLGVSYRRCTRGPSRVFSTSLRTGCRKFHVVLPSVYTEFKADSASCSKRA